jgi:hypothetical protein
MTFFAFIRQFIQERLFVYRLLFQNTALRHPRTDKA